MEYQQLTDILLALKFGLYIVLIMLISPTADELLKVINTATLTTLLMFNLVYALVPISIYISYQYLWQ